LKLEVESALKLALHFENARRVLGQKQVHIMILNFSHVEYNCPQDILLSNTTVMGLHQAQNSVTAINVTTGTNTTFKAGNIIQLFNGFTAPANEDFSGEIEDCITNFGTDGDQN